MVASGEIRDFGVSFDELDWIGRDLVRPESVIADPDGALWCSDGRGGATRIDPDGDQKRFLGWGGEPNGLALAPDGRLVTANIALGRVQAMRRDGTGVETLLEEVDGQPLTCANHVHYDSRGRLWITCTTRAEGWWECAADPRPDGFVVLADEQGARIVADGIYAANESRLDPEERFLYVAETMKARVLRFPLRPDGSLGEREVYGPDGLGSGAYTDGIAFDAEGNLWVATVARNGVGVLTPDGEWHVVIEDPREEALTAFREKREAGTVAPDDLFAAAGERLQFVSSLCFTGEDRRTVVLGSLAMDRLPRFRAPVAGLA